jgi:hypothetical protein
MVRELELDSGIYNRKFKIIRNKMVKKFGEREGERKFFGSIMLCSVGLGLETTDTVEGTL